MTFRLKSKKVERTILPSGERGAAIVVPMQWLREYNLGPGDQVWLEKRDGEIVIQLSQDGGSD